MQKGSCSPERPDNKVALNEAARKILEDKSLEAMDRASKGEFVQLTVGDLIAIASGSGTLTAFTQESEETPAMAIVITLEPEMVEKLAHMFNNDPDLHIAAAMLTPSAPLMDTP